MRKEDCIGRVRMSNLVRQRLPSEDNKEFNGSVVPPLLILFMVEGEKKRKCFRFSFSPFFPFCSFFLEIFGVVCPVGGETGLLVLSSRGPGLERISKLAY